MSRPIYAVSVSKIESFRKFIYGQTETNASWNTYENLMATLRGEFKQLDSAKYGECFHAIIEGVAKRVEGVKIRYVSDNVSHTATINGYQHGEVIISDKQAKHALAYRDKHPRMVKEVPVKKLYHTRNADIIITGRVDGMEGNTVRDTKTKYGKIDIHNDYVKSYQWRLYLDMVQGMKAFYYDLFVVTGYSTPDTAPFARVEPLEEMYCAPYPNMDKDVQIIIQEFVDFIDYYNLQPLITPSPARLLKLNEELLP